jgi:hypothetical protein
VDDSTSKTDAAPDAPANGEGQKPDDATTNDAGTPAKTFDEAYVKQLRSEAATNRKRLADAEARLRDFEDRDKTETEKLTARAAESEARAVEAEAKLLRLAVAAERKMPASAVALLHGTTRDEIEASAEALAEFAKDTEKPAPTFDGGARTTPEETKPPERAHNDFLLRAMGRQS